MIRTTRANPVSWPHIRRRRSCFPLHTFPLKNPDVRMMFEHFNTLWCDDSPPLNPLITFVHELNCGAD